MTSLVKYHTRLVRGKTSRLFRELFNPADHEGYALAKRMLG
ncbi:hypothetical protein [Verrucomicrobium spinosum]|nr:hypothetical protein [Verrucomicrobium spinosum]